MLILTTKEFKAACSIISSAHDLDKNTANLEITTEGDKLYLNVGSKDEYYVSVSFDMGAVNNFHAVVQAQLFLNLISGITTDTFSIDFVDNVVEVWSGKSRYKLPVIYENDKLMKLPKIYMENVTVEMDIENSILKSILNVNSKEISKLSGVTIDELMKLYYITNEGCFTFTVGSTLNSFKLEKPVQLILNEHIVRLFKLFDEDVHFKMSHDALSNGAIQTKVSFESSNIRVVAVVSNNDTLLTRIKAPCSAAKEMIERHYPYSIVVSTQSLSSAVARLSMFSKNSLKDSGTFNSALVKAKFHITPDGEFFISDGLGNIEYIKVENEKKYEQGYEMTLNLVDIKSACDSSKDAFVTLNFGNKLTATICRQNIVHLLMEYDANGNK